MAVSMETTTAARTLTVGVCELLPLCELVFRVCVCVCTLHTHRFRLNSMALPRLSMWSVLRKWRTQTHFKHAHAFFHQRSSDDKTFPRPSPHDFFFFSDLLSALMDVAAEPVCRRTPGVFAGFLCTLCLDCGLLLTSLWLQTH